MCYMKAALSKTSAFGICNCIPELSTVAGYSYFFVTSDFTF